MKKLFFSLTLLFLFISAYAQPAQTIRGKVVDNESQFPLIGVTVIVTQDGEEKGTVSDVDGNFRFKNVNVGRVSIAFSYIGYETYEIPDVIVNAGKEVILDIKMSESFEKLEEVQIVARKAGQVVNDMAIVSAREFSVQETNRYAGSRGEPARMASNFAGVQGADDSRNDIIIRGNSPQGVLWRLEGINIPNPNHFSIPGTGGGPVTILNNKFLKNSDFFTGAFPAEYGNGIAGVFDLRMRNGNNEKHEFSGQLGFLGTELMAEGPISKSSKASYLATYRYSTLKLFEFMGISLGTDAVPQYQDGAVRLNFPFKNGGNLSFFGIGGNSKVNIQLSTTEKPDNSTQLYGSNDRDQLFSSRMGVVGATYTQPLDANTFFKLGTAVAHSKITADHDYIVRHVENGKYVVDSLPQILDYSFRENKYSAYGFVNKKLNTRLSLKAGMNLDALAANYIDSVRVVGFQNPDNPDPSKIILSDWSVRWNADEMTYLAQPYVQAKYRISKAMTFTGGLTAVYHSMNKNSLSALEPRLGLSYQLSPTQKLSLGLGRHSQTQSNYLYYYGTSLGGGKIDTYNKDLGLTKNNHAVLSYDAAINKSTRLKAETYYQYLQEIPVEIEKSGFSLVNSGSGFSRFFPNKLQNTGVGQNYGVELTVEKSFSSNYFLLFTGSLFDSKYKGSDDIWRNTVFNGNYTFNALIGKEFKFKRSSLNLGSKITTAGGRRYGDVDTEASVAAQDIVYKTNENLYKYKFKPYFRMDAKVNYRFNTSRITHEIAVDFVNIFNTENILTISYVPDESRNYQNIEKQLGFLPLFYYRIDF